MPTWSLTHCAYCGAEIEQAATGRPRRYCSPACRTADWRARVMKVNRIGAAVLRHTIYQAVAVAPRLAATVTAREENS